MNTKTSPLAHALEFAQAAHNGQWQEGEYPLPYVTHPIEVLMNLRYVGGITDQEMLCAALLHDTVEAESATFDQIEREFGPKVRSLVKELTRNEPTAVEIAGLTKDQIWQLRADMLVEEISRMSPDAQQIKLADRLANVRAALRQKRGRKLHRYLTQTRKILELVPPARNKALWNAILSELERD